MAVTQRDIAKQLNMSQSTVAKVLKNSPNVWVSAPNRERILSAAREMNYRPQMRFGRFGAVTCVYISPGSLSTRVAYSIAIDVLGERLEKLGFELKVRIYSDQHSLLNSLERLSTKCESAAFVLWGSETAVEEQARVLENANAPFVVKGRFEIDHPDWLQADFDHEDMMERSVKHLASLGPRRIASIGHPSLERYMDCLIDGYRGAMRRLDLEVPSDLIAIGNGSPEHGEAAMGTWLAMPVEDRPTAVVMATGTAAWQGVEKALVGSGGRLGDGEGQFAIAGTSFSDLQLSIGHGTTLESVMLDSLSSAMVDGLLVPLLMGETIKNPVIRLQPNLVPVPSLELLG
jgi:LacI family transcriptional regulator